MPAGRQPANSYSLHSRVVKRGPEYTERIIEVNGTSLTDLFVITHEAIES